MHIMCLVNEENCRECTRNNEGDLTEFTRNYNHAKRWAPTEILRHFTTLGYENYLIMKISQSVGYPFNLRHTITLIPYHAPPQILNETDNSIIEKYILRRWKIYKLVKSWEEDETEHLQFIQIRNRFEDQGYETD